MITPKTIKELAKAMQSCGVISIKTPEVEIIVQPVAHKARKRRIKGMEEAPTKLSNDFRGYSDEEVLAWSAPTEG